VFVVATGILRRIVWALSVIIVACVAKYVDNIEFYDLYPPNLSFSYTGI
jgi:hypothetical protein